MPAGVLHLLADLPEPSGHGLRAAREAAGLTQAQAAELMGMSSGRAVANAEAANGVTSIRLALLLLATGQHPTLTVTAKP
jgi:transcriptional regulator with XRE-family HTH domain